MPAPSAATLSKKGSPITVTIMGRDFQMVCPPNERQALLDAAQMVDDKMRAVRDGGKIVGMDRIAVLVALNLANELMSASGSTEHYAQNVNQQIGKLCDKISHSLNQHKQLDL